MGGTDESLDTFKSFLNQHYPTLKVPFSWAPPFRPLTPEEDDWAVEQIASSQVDILFVGIGCPKQERWMHAHRTSIKAVQLGVGAAFDFHSGSVKQAPSWMQNAGLEWLFRLTMEPGRLWRRYVLLNPRFMARARMAVAWTKTSPRSSHTAAFSIIGLIHSSTAGVYVLGQAKSPCCIGCESRDGRFTMENDRSGHGQHARTW